MFGSKSKGKNTAQEHKPEPDYDACYKSAFGLTIADIQGADNVSVECLFNALRDNTGDIRKQAKALLACLGTTDWRWRGYGKPIKTEKDYKKMAEALAGRIDILSHQLYRREQLIEVAESRPYWEFVAGDEEDTPSECKDADRTIRHFTDLFWQEHLPPCGHPNCRCKVFSHSESSLQRRGKKA